MGEVDWLAAFCGEDRHPCIFPGCQMEVEYDDEPWCFTHSPDSGSAVPGYSYRATAGRASAAPVPYGTVELTAGIPAPAERDPDDEAT